MRDAPRLLIGVNAIAAHAGITPRLAQHMVNQRTIPAFRVGETTMATAAGLDEWSLLKRLGKF